MSIFNNLDKECSCKYNKEYFCNPVVQCRSCIYGCDKRCKQMNLDQTQKRIQNTVRVSSSEYTMNKLSFTVSSNTQSINNIPYLEKGVEVKHGSYNRYLANKKGRNPLKGGWCVNKPIYYRPPALQGGKNVKFGIINNCNC